MMFKKKGNKQVGQSEERAVTKEQETTIDIAGLTDDVVEMFPKLNEKYTSYKQLMEEKKLLQITMSMQKSRINSLDPVDDFMRIAEAEEELNNLRHQAVELSKKMKNTDYNITDEEYRMFKEAFEREYKLLGETHDFIENDIAQKTAELMELYNRKYIVERMAIRRTSRASYVDYLKNNGMDYNVSLNLMNDSVFEEKNNYSSNDKAILAEAVDNERKKVFRAYYEKKFF